MKTSSKQDKLLYPQNFVKWLSARDTKRIVDDHTALMWCLLMRDGGYPAQLLKDISGWNLEHNAKYRELSIFAIANHIKLEKSRFNNNEFVCPIHSSSGVLKGFSGHRFKGDGIVCSDEGLLEVEAKSCNVSSAIEWSRQHEDGGIQDSFRFKKLYVGIFKQLSTFPIQILCFTEPEAVLAVKSLLSELQQSKKQAIAKDQQRKGRPSRDTIKISSPKIKEIAMKFGVETIDKNTIQKVTDSLLESNPVLVSRFRRHQSDLRSSHSIQSRVMRCYANESCNADGLFSWAQAA